MDSLSFISSDNQNINELTQTNNINSTLSLGSSVTSLASSSSSASALSSISTFLAQQGQSLYLPSTLTTIGNLTDSFLSDLLPITASVNNFVNGTLDNFSNAIIGTTIQPPFLLDIAVPAAAAAAAAAASITTIDTTITTTTTTGTSVIVDAATSQPVLETEQLHHLQAIGVSVILLIVILGTVIGNVLVCVAVCLVRKLRRPCNYLLVSLAVSDLCVAILVMPTALIYEVLGKWTFGTVFCDVWVSFDVLSCTASILNLCAISVDRYWAITKPLEYGVKRTPRRMMMCVALVWLGAACISLPPLLILGNEHYTEDGVTPLCAVCQNFGYQIYATLGSFYIPLTVMLFVYYQIFRAARRIVMDEKRAQTRLETALNGGAQEKPIEPGGGGGGNLIPSPHQKKLRFQLAKERKASTTLGIIMSAFTVCWLPFFILALVRPFLKEDQGVPKTLSSLFLWLGYANSLLNPIIYATLNRDFRKPFQEILYFRCSNLNLMMREDFYHSQYGEPASQRVVLGGEGHGARESFL